MATKSDVVPLLTCNFPLGVWRAAELGLSRRVYLLYYMWTLRLISTLLTTVEPFI